MRLMQLVISLEIGGTERLVADLARRLRVEADITLCCLDRLGVWGEELQREGIPVHCLRRSPGVDLRTVWRLGRLLRRHRIDILHCHQYSALFYGALASLLSPSTKVLFTEHGRAYPDIVSRKRALGNLALARLADGITSVSHAVRQALVDFERLPARRIQVVYNGVEPQLYTAPLETAAFQRVALGIAPEELAIGTVGRLDPVKDHLTLIEAFAIVRQHLPQVKLFIVGDGEMRVQLECAIRTHHLTHAVSILGFRADVPSLLAAFDVFALSSRNEGMPVTILEAMAAGLPVVATAVGDNPSIVEDGMTGRLCPCGEPGQFAHTLIELLRDESARRRMGIAGRERVLQHFTSERMLKQYRSIYDSLMGNNSLCAVSLDSSITKVE
jgi:glycosyltransferase involved in cell wall biosynthesis